MDDSWADAINETLGTDLAKAEPEEVDDDNNKPKEDEKDTNQEIKELEKKPEEDALGEKDKENPQAKVEEIRETEKEEINPKDSIKQALKELEIESIDNRATREDMKKKVLDSFYPEGLSRQLLDSDGDPITGIEDLEKLVNPKTQQLFTEEEAGRWLLEHQQKLNKNIEELENNAMDIVDTNMSLKESAAEVERRYGDLLKALPDVSDKILEAYQKTLVKDPNTGIIMKAPVDVIEFYDIALQGYKEVAKQMLDKSNAEIKEKEKADAEQAKLNQQERGDLLPKGSSNLPLDEDEKGWDSAMNEYYNKK